MIMINTVSDQSVYGVLSTLWGTKADTDLLLEIIMLVTEEHYIHDNDMYNITWIGSKTLEILKRYIQCFNYFDLKEGGVYNVSKGDVTFIGKLPQL